MKEFFKNLKFSWSYAKNQKGRLIKYVICQILMIVVWIVIPILTANIIVSLTSNEFNQLILTAITIFVVENTHNIINYFSRKYSFIIYRDSFTKLEIELGKEILKIENKVMDENGSGVFIQRLSNDTSRLSDIFNVLANHISSLITDIGVFVAIFIINKIVFAYLIIVNIVLYIIENKRTKRYNENDKINRQKTEQITGFIGEMVKGQRDIKMLNSEESFIDELSNKLVDVNDAKYNMQRVDIRFKLLRGTVMDINSLLIIVLLVVLIQYNALPIASALIIHNYSRGVSYMINDIGLLLEKIKDFNLSSTRIFDILHSEEFKKEKFGKKHLEKVEGNFEFKNVEFSYENNKVLKKVSFKINANETVAFVGKSGAGKSTIFSLLCKMYDINSGSITIDGVDIRELDKESIRGNITIISQNPYIFNLSIKENLKLVKKDLTDEEMINACKIACLHEFIIGLPNQYDTVVGEGGVNLSGGQKQRLAIARALIQKTEIILFDEATSALDNETQTEIQNAINNMKGEYTMLIIAHRLSTIINSDRIILLDDGKIIAEGSHKELLENCEKYKHLYESEIRK